MSSEPSAAESEGNKVEQVAATSFATLLLAIAGIVGLKRPEITLWTVFLAGACYTFAVHKNLKKRTLTLAIAISLVIASVGAQIWLITWHRDQERKATTMPHQKATTEPSKAIQTGAATTKGLASPAVTGTVGSMNITVDGEEGTSKNKKKKAQPK